jgi:ligand-binding sensor domain-containing protein
MKKSLVLFPVVLLLFLLNARLALSQQVTFQEVASPIGNFSNLVGSIAQDKNGYMWIATSGGLYKYDGYRFKLFSHDPANPNSPGENKMELVYADSKGIIWIATWTNGLDRLDPVTGTFTHFRHSPDVPGSLSNNTVRALLEDREGTLWVGTNRGLDKFDPKTEKFQNYHNDPANPSSLSCDRVRKLYEDRAGNIWVGTGSVWSNDGGEPGEGGLNRFDKKTGSFFRYLHDPTNTHSLINNKVQAICEDSRGTFWVGTAGDGLHIMDKAAGTFKRQEYDAADPEKLSRPPLKNGFGTDHITFIAEDALGKIWVGTLGNGIVRHDPKRGTTTHYTNKDQSAGFTHTSAWSFCNSRDGMFWIGTFQGGLFRVDPYQKDIQHISTGSRVTSISEDPVSGTWVGTPEGLFLRNKVTGNIKKFTSSPATSGSISNNQITSLFHDNEGVLWIGTANGLNRLNKLRVDLYPVT